MANELLNAALNYASKGLAVFPCNARAKTPRTAHGVNDATRDPAVIKKWWTNWPDSNIGIACGQASGGLAVIDLDIKADGTAGADSLNEWESRNGPLPETAISVTGKGGRHLLYRVDHLVKNKVDLLPGVDVRGDGGYIVAPPSIHPNGRRYKWERSFKSTEIAEADETVRTLLDSCEKDRSEKPLSIPEEIPQGQRNDTIFKLACSLQAKGLADETIVAACMKENELKCYPMLQEQEVLTLVKSALRYGKGQLIGSPEFTGEDDLAVAVKAGRDIFIVYDPEDAEELRNYGLLAVATEGWVPEYAMRFIGIARAVIVAKHDEAGKKWSSRVSKDLRSVIYSHVMITPSIFNGGSVKDYLTDEDGTIEGLLDMVNGANQVMAIWLGGSEDKPKVNADLLSAEIMKHNDLFIARNPGTRSDLVFWYQDGVYKQMVESEIGAEVRLWFPIGRAAPEVISRVVRMIMYSAPIRKYEEINADERYINCLNGLIDIDTGNLLPHTPEIISSLKLRAEFNEEAEAPMWAAFIDSLCLDPETEEVDTQMRAVLQEWTGIILSPIYGYRIKKALILYSALGNSGKTVFLSVLCGILGASAVANVDFKSLGASRWATGRVFGRRCIAVGDEGGSRVESSAVFKQLTGGDIVSAELKGLQGFDFRFTGIILALCNLLPYFEDDKGNHIAERLTLLNCRHTIPETKRDPRLVDKLLTERDGILLWAWTGLKRFLDNGYCFSSCESADDLKREYRARHDSMYAFLQDEMEITGDKRDVIRKTDLEHKYSIWCLEHDQNELSKKNIVVRLASLGVPCKTKDGYQVYRGVRPKTDHVTTNSG